MELFLPLPVIESKNFFHKRFLIKSNDFKIVFRNRKWYYLNRKWNYFSPFQSSDQKTSLTKVSPFGPMIPKWFSETGNGIIWTGNGIISPLSSHWIKKNLLQKYPHLVQQFQNGFQKKEMEWSEQEMELFLPFPVFRSKNFFNKSIPILSINSKMIDRNRKWNFLNRKWNYFSPFQSSDQKTSLI